MGNPSFLSGLTLLIPFITGVITHLLSGMSHQVYIGQVFFDLGSLFFDLTSFFDLGSLFFDLGSLFSDLDLLFLNLGMFLFILGLLPHTCLEPCAILHFFSVCV